MTRSNEATPNIEADTTLPRPTGPSSAGMGQGQLYFRQLLAGRDVARGDEGAGQLRNYIYLVGDRKRNEAVAVDLAFAVDDVLGILDADGMHLRSVLVTHHHADHVGGILGRWRIEGLPELLAGRPVPVHTSRSEMAAISSISPHAADDFVPHDNGDTIMVGDIPIKVLHTPGHTSGSQCFLVDGKLISGDTLFLEGCGRTDMPDGDPVALFHSLQYLASLPDDKNICPRHRYSAASQNSLGAVKQVNLSLSKLTEAEWLRLFAPPPFRFGD